MKNLAGIIPISGVKTDFNMPWHESLMPIAPNYLAAERAVLECAYAGCETIWIVCPDDVTPLLRYHIGEIVEDPVYTYRHFEFNKAEVKRPIRIYYIPINIRDINKRDNLGWSAIYGAYSSNKIISKISKHLAPERFWIAWPYGYSAPPESRQIRKDLQRENVMLAHGEDSIQSGSYLGFSLDIAQVKQLLSESRTRSTGLWVNPDTREKRYSKEERYSYRNFNLKKVFETLDYCNYNVHSVKEYYSLDSWQNYCQFLSAKSDLKKPKILKSQEWNEVGLDE